MSAAQLVPQWLSLAEANTTGEERVNQGLHRGDMERDQEAERRQEAEQKVPHGLPEHPLSPPARRVCLAGTGRAEDPLVYQRGLGPKAAAPHVLRGCAVSALPTQPPGSCRSAQRASRPLPAAVR